MMTLMHHKLHLLFFIKFILKDIVERETKIQTILWKESSNNAKKKRKSFNNGINKNLFGALCMYVCVNQEIGKLAGTCAHAYIWKVTQIFYSIVTPVEGIIKFIIFLPGIIRSFKILLCMQMFSLRFFISPLEFSCLYPSILNTYKSIVPMVYFFLVK